MNSGKYRYIGKNTIQILLFLFWGKLDFFKISFNVCQYWYWYQLMYWYRYRYTQYLYQYMLILILDIYQYWCPYILLVSISVKIMIPIYISTISLILILKSEFHTIGTTDTDIIPNKPDRCDAKLSLTHHNARWRTTTLSFASSLPANFIKTWMNNAEEPLLLCWCGRFPLPFPQTAS